MRNSLSIVYHFFYILLFYFFQWLLLTYIPSSKFGYLLLAPLSDFTKWYPHIYFFVFFAVRLFCIVPYLFLIFGFFKVFLQNSFSQLEIDFILLFHIFIFIFIYPYYWLLSSIAVVFLIATRIKEDAILWEDFSSKKFLLIIIFLSLAIRIGWILISENKDCGDAAARLYVSYLWVELFCKFPSIFWIQILNPAIDFLPLNFHLIGISIFISNDEIYAPRVFMSLIGAFSTLPLYLLTQKKFNKKTAIAASLILVFYLQHIILSTQILSECLYLFFLLWGFYFIERAKKSETKNYKTIWIGISLSCCCLLRYEGWFFSGLVLLLLPFILNLSIKSWLKIGLPIFFSTLLVMLCEMASSQHPLRGILFSDREVALTYLNGESKYQDVFNNLPVAFLPFYLLSFLVYFISIVSKISKDKITLFLLYFLPILPFAIKIANQTLTSQSRYLTLYMVPAIPFIGNLLVRCVTFIKFNKYTFSIVLISYLFLANVFMVQRIKGATDYLKYPNGFINSMTYVKKNITKCQIYLDYADELAGFNWIVYSKTMDIPHIFTAFDSTFYRANQTQIDSIFLTIFPKNCIVRLQNKTDFNLSVYNELISKNKISHIMLFPKGMLSKELKFSKKIEYYNGHKYEQLFSENGYMFYCLQKEDE